MAGLRNVAVTGIRSFGPDATDRQTLKFERPLTLILGDNGCGKSTLLESILFALCDELPPGSDRGHSFVHNPALRKTAEVRGQVKLEFNDASGKPYLVVRSLQLQMKQKNMKFQRLDNCIKTFDTKNKPVEVSGRCGDTTATIAQILGVSKAVLSNVIFCHQEDSNWPLDEGKKLKERFDAIFDATKYNKCLENIRKLRKQYSLDIKLLETRLSCAAEKKEEVDNKKRRLFADEEKINSVNENIQEIQNELAPISERIQTINTIERNFVEYKSKEQTARERIKNCQMQQRDLEKSIKKIFEGTDDELLDEIESFHNNLKQKQTSLSVAEKRIGTLKINENKINADISANDMKKSELFTLEGQNQEKIAQRNKRLLNIADFMDLDKPNDLEEDGSAENLAEMITIKHTSKKTELKDLSKRINAEERSLQDKIDECQAALIKHTEIITGKRNEHRRTSNQQRELEKEIADTKNLISKLEKVKANMEQAEEIYTNISKEVDVPICENTIAKTENEVTQLESEQRKYEKLIGELQSQNSTVTEVNIHKQSLSAKQKNFTRLMNKNKDSMSEIVGDKIPERNYKNFFQNQLEKFKNDIQSLEKCVEKQRKEITVLEANRSHNQNELDRKKAELTKTEEQVFKFCKKSPLEDVLKKLDAQIALSQDQKSELVSSEFTVKKHISKLEGGDSGCPLCHRNFDNESEVSDLISELRDNIRNVPKKLETLQQRLSKEISERDQLVGLRPVEARLNLLKNEEIPALERKISESENTLEDKQTSLEDLSMSLADPQSKQSTIEGFISDMTLMDQLNNEIASIETNIRRLEATLTPVDTEFSLDELNAKNTEVKDEIAKLRAAIKTDQMKLSQHIKKLNIAREEKNNLKEKYLQIQSKAQELYSVQNRLDEVVELKNKLDGEITELTDKSAAFESNLKSAKDNKATVIKELKREESDLRSFDSKLDGMLGIVNNLNNEIKKHERKNIPGELDKLRELLESLNAKKEQITADLSCEIINVDTIKDEISNQTLNKRDLDDNLMLRKSKKEQQKLQVVIQEMADKIGEMNPEALLKEKRKLITKESDMIKQIATNEGEIKQLKNSVEEIKRELRLKQYKNVEDEYKSLMCELEILKLADKDIKDYAFAMDCCLMKYHKEKMEKINCIIRDLWRSIYRGNDIDFIEIKTDESTVKAGNANKRVYNYRVVQQRNDVEIDMRGSCSSGQKVLASLIIRMALAETFSNRFGVLALDEPTTNLDRENVLSLCSALRDMVLSRMKQKNFMFIIITHDTEFLTSLGKVDKLTHYYKISRNQDGKSRITRELMA